MQSKMTEAEFEKRLGELLVSRSPTEPTVRLAKEVAREAGLEFAPEPVKLPESVEWRSGALWPAGRMTMVSSAKEAIGTAAADRYNAYPGLREKAEELVAVLGDVIVSRCMDELKAELAQGPRP